MDFATNVKAKEAFKVAFDAIIGTLWVNIGDNLPSFRIMEPTQYVDHLLEVTNPANTDPSNSNIAMFRFMVDGHCYLTAYYDVTKAASKQAVELVDNGITSVHQFGEALAMVTAYYANAMEGK